MVSTKKNKLWAQEVTGAWKIHGDTLRIQGNYSLKSTKECLKNVFERDKHLLFFHQMHEFGWWVCKKITTHINGANLGGSGVISGDFHTQIGLDPWQKNGPLWRTTFSLAKIGKFYWKIRVFKTISTSISSCFLVKTGSQLSN